MYSNKITSLVDLFNLGMMRDYPEIKQRYTEGKELNIGPGNKHIDGCQEIEYPQYDAEKDLIPFANDEFDVIHCYHFLEHIRNVPMVIAEINRVLKPGGHANIVVPYYKSAMQAQDLDHKSQFTEKTFGHLFNNEYYSKGKCVTMDIATNFIMGDCEANLCLVVQLVKKES